MFQLNQPLLINILGHAAGALIFAIFLCLPFSRRGWSGAAGIGLQNVQRRLRFTRGEQTTTVEFSIPMAGLAAHR